MCPSRPPRRSSISRSRLASPSAARCGRKMSKEKKKHARLSFRTPLQAAAAPLSLSLSASLSLFEDIAHRPVTHPICLSFPALSLFLPARAPGGLRVRAHRAERRGRGGRERGRGERRAAPFQQQGPLRRRHPRRIRHQGGLGGVGVKGVSRTLSLLEWREGGGGGGGAGASLHPQLPALFSQPHHRHHPPLSTIIHQLAAHPN